jgi:hypothetical protein
LRLWLNLIGAVSVIQRFSSSLALNPHFHVLVTDGLYDRDQQSDEHNGPVDTQMMVGRSGIDGSIFEHFCDNDPSPSLLARDVKFNGVEQCSWFSSPLNWWRG